MSDMAPEICVAALESEPRRVILHLRDAGGGLHAWSLPNRGGDLDKDRALREFIQACGEARLACFHAEELSKHLSRPEVLPLARRLLGRLEDMREQAMIWLPLEPEYSLEALVPRITEAGLPEVLARTVEVLALVERAVSAADPYLLEAMAPVLATESAFARVPWPPGAAVSANVLQLAKALPAVPERRKRDGRNDDIPGDIRDIAIDMLSPGGMLEQVHPSYEHRQGQVDMAAEVADAMRDSRFLVVEAGTGVGKSLAYLIPAILCARREDQPVVISTNTRNLQEQLIDKDLPLLHEALPIDFEAALLKGRGNYPCLRALMTFASDAANSLMRGERLAAAYVMSWLVASEGGDVAELSPHALELVPEISRAVDRVRSQADSCIGRTCSHFNYCPVQVARAWARRADIIVSNHALTLEDTKAPILPKYTRLVIDEAQNLENVATDNLSLEFSSYGANRLMRSMVEEPSGFVPTARRRLEEQEDSPRRQAALDALELVKPAVSLFEDAVGQFGELLFEFCFIASTDQRARDRATVRLVDEVFAADEWLEVLGLGDTAIEAGAELVARLEAFSVALADLDVSATPGSEGLKTDAEAVRMRVAEAMRTLHTVLHAPGDHVRYVVWAEAWTGRRGDSWSLQAAPVDVGPVLEEALYSTKETIVFTSATMTVDGAFSYFRQRIGLNEHHEKLVEVSVPSPFDLTEQLLLCIPQDMPDPSDAAYNQAIIDALGQICQVTEGGTLALFTARNRMIQAFEALEDDLRSSDMTPLCQDVSGPRSALLERLKADPRAVLFGLKSFWEGVDVPGRALRCVVITKLPFAVPNDPIIQARQEDAARRGLDPMNEYYIPEAIVGFKQGFGRLIRTQTDTGVVFVLDRRVLTKWYGRRFFQSIQRCELAREPLEDCLARAAGWLGKR